MKLAIGLAPVDAIFAFGSPRISLDLLVAHRIGAELDAICPEHAMTAEKLQAALGLADEDAVRGADPSCQRCGQVSIDEMVPERPGRGARRCGAEHDDG